MKIITVILILTICLSAFALPAAAKEGGGKDTGTAGPDNTGNGTGLNTAKTDEAANATPQVRETNRQEVREGNRSGISGEPPARNLTEGRPTGAGNMSVPYEQHGKSTATSGTATPVRAGWSKNDNEVRSAVHALLALENRTGGIGPEVSAIAREFNNSAEQTWQLEKRIQDRDAVSRFLFGGDQVSAAALANLTIQNQERIRQITALVNTGDIDTETRAQLEEQVRVIEQENTRLGQVASAEQQGRGLLSWL